MACNCCKPGGCSCKMRTSDVNAEEPTFTIYPFSYGFNYKMAPWINRPYPEPIFMATWNRKFNQYLGSNHVLDNVTGRIRFQGDMSMSTTRPGLTAGQGLGGWLVEDGNGDNSGPWKQPPIPSQYRGSTVFALEEKQDSAQRKCQLWAKFKRFTPVLDENGIFVRWEEGPWGELELLHSMSWDEPFQAQLIISISGDHFNGPTSVELRYQCINPCFVFNNTNDGGVALSTWEFTGQADWVTESTAQFPLDPCKSYGSYDGNVTWNYINCNGSINTTTNNRSRKVFLNAYQSCGFQYGFSATFAGYGGGFCQEVEQPCDPPYNDQYYCCGNLYGGYTTQPDGTESCGLLSEIVPWSTYVDDIWNREVIDSKTVRFNGIFMNAVLNRTYTTDCSTYIPDVDPSYEYKLGTILATGV